MINEGIDLEDVHAVYTDPAIRRDSTTDTHYEWLQGADLLLLVNKGTGAVKRVQTVDDDHEDRRAPRQRPHKAPPTGAAKGSKSKRGGRFPTDMKDIIKEIKRAEGWQVVRARGGIAAISPSGKKLILPTRTNALQSNILNACKRLEHEGLNLRRAN